MKNYNKKRVCQCIQCKKIFDIGDLKQVERNLYNIKIKEKKCPYCGGDYRLLKDDLYERNRDHWILHNPPTSKEKINWMYYNREN